MFGRATMTLGIGPHFSLALYLSKELCNVIIQSVCVFYNMG